MRSHGDVGKTILVTLWPQVANQLRGINPYIIPSILLVQMRKLLFVALVALCAAFQGEVRAESPTLETICLKTQVSDLELEWVLNQVVEQSGLSYLEARSQYENGKLTIEKVNVGYLVTYSTDGGGIGIIIAEDEL